MSMRKRAYQPIESNNLANWLIGPSQRQKARMMSHEGPVTLHERTGVLS